MLGIEETMGTQSWTPIPRSLLVFGPSVNIFSGFSSNWLILYSNKTTVLFFACPLLFLFIYFCLQVRPVNQKQSYMMCYSTHFMEGDKLSDREAVGFL